MTDVQNYPTPGVNYLTPGDDCPAPGVNFLTPGDNFPAPGDNYPAPGVNYPAPGVNYPAPGVNYPAPGVNFLAPGDNYPAPGDNYPAPGQAQGGPSSGSSLLPSYPSGEVQMDPPPAYMPPPYTPHPALYPPPPSQAGCCSDPLPPGEAGFPKAGDQCSSVGAPAYDLLSAVQYSKKYEVVRDSQQKVSGILPLHNNALEDILSKHVFSVLTVQLLVTFSVVCVFTFSSVVKAAVQNNIWVYISSYVLFLVVALCLSFSTSLTRTHPWNLVGLSVVTLSLSYMVGTVASFHNTTAVVIAMGATLVISFTIIIFSAQTRVDLTVCNGILLVLSVNLLMFGFFCCFYYSHVLQIVYGCLGSLLFALFLAIDCQLVMGREKYSLSPEEYVFAALILYVDITTIFLYLLILLGGSSSN